LNIPVVTLQPSQLISRMLRESAIDLGVAALLRDDAMFVGIAAKGIAGKAYIGGKRQIRREASLSRPRRHATWATIATRHLRRNRRATQGPNQEKESRLTAPAKKQTAKIENSSYGRQ